MKETIGDRIRQVRKEKGLTQGEVADKLGLSGASAVSQWENDGTGLSGFNLMSLSRLFDVTPDWILEGGLDRQRVTATNSKEIPILGTIDDIETWLRDQAPDTKRETITSFMVRSARAFAFAVPDDALLPEISKGTLIIVDPDFVVRADADPNQALTALVSKNGHAAYRLVSYDMGERIYKAMSGDYAALKESDVEVIGYAVSRPELSVSV